MPVGYAVDHRNLKNELVAILHAQKPDNPSIREPAMQNANRKLCPFCAAEIPQAFIVCNHCGRALHTMKVAYSKTTPKADVYEIVQDGIDFGIALRGEVKIHGLALETAQKAVALLNSVLGLEQVG
jgi:hypothetical protein